MSDYSLTNVKQNMSALAPTSRIDLSDRQFEIITAAGKLLTRSGVTGLTIKNLAKEMHFSESAIYRHFASKEDIIVSMLYYLAYDMDGRFKQAMNNAESAETMFLKLFRNQAAFFSENPYFVIVVFSDGLSEESERINKAIETIMETKMSHLMPIIVAGQKNGFLKTDLSPEELVHIIMGTFRLLMYKWRVSDFKFNLKARNDKMLQSLLTLIKK